MDMIRLLLRIIGYAGFSLFFIQVLNLYLELFKHNVQFIKISFITGIVSLFILVLVDRLINKEDKYYAKHVEK
jgi:hypothetical protein